MNTFTESIVEDAALDWLADLGYTILHGPEIAPGEPFAECDDYGQVILAGRLRQALQCLNPVTPPAALDEAFRRLTRPDSPSLVANNHTLHRYLVDGVPVEVQQPDGSFRGDLIRVLDHDDPADNEFLTINQFTVVEDRRERRPDVVLFVNGLPLAVIELKNPADEAADLWRAHNQLQTYKAQIPSLFVYNAVLVVSDGVQARIGTLTADREWFLPWRTVTGETLAPVSLLELQVVLQGVFDKRRFLDLVAHFIIFEDVGGGTLVKKMAGYHQYHAVNVAVDETVRACAPGDEATGVSEGRGTYLAQPARDAQPGDRRVGVVWPSPRATRSPATAASASSGTPRARAKASRWSSTPGASSCTPRCRILPGNATLQRGNEARPEPDDPISLSDRRNIVVIADEAHRSQYDFIDGFARHMRDALPNASFIAFTGTPIELADRNTRAVFGDSISVYDIQQAVHDGATVPISYESRLAKLALDETERPKVDFDFDEATEGEEVEQKEHFEHRLEVMDGKAMIVAMSRRICVELYDALVALRPAWQEDGSLKIVMTGSATDPLDWQPHIRTKAAREELARRFKDPRDPFRIVIVRDMWLTGFDAPCLHTMYLDKPMHSHGLMQGIARVNRVYKDKPGGLVVDYPGLANELREALAVYTESGGQGETAIDQEEAVAAMMEKYEVCRGLFHGFNWSRGSLARQRRASRSYPLPRSTSSGKTTASAAQQRHHRLDHARECARQNPRDDQAHPAPSRLPAGQAGEGHADRVGTGRGAVQGVGGSMKYRLGILP